MAPRTLSLLGISKVMTMTSTYDHRIIQGAESGVFLARMRSCCAATTASTSASSRTSGVPHRPVTLGDRRQRRRSAPAGGTEGRSRSRPASCSSSTPTACAATSWPTSTPSTRRARRTRSSTRPPTASPSGTSTASSSPTASAGKDRADAARDPRRPARDLLRHDRRRVHAHRTTASARSWLQERMEPAANRCRSTPPDRRRILEQLMEAEIFEQFLHTKYVGQKRFSLEGGEALIPLLDRRARRRGRSRASRRSSSAWPTAAGSTCSRTSSASRWRRSSRSSRATSTRTYPGLGRREVPPRRHAARHDAGQRRDAGTHRWPPTRATSRR